MTTSHTADASTVPVARIPGMGWGRWRPLLDALQALPAAKARRVMPRLSRSDIRSLRSAARWRHRGFHVRQTPSATWVWLGGKVDGFEKYRGKKK